MQAVFTVGANPLVGCFVKVGQQYPFNSDVNTLEYKTAGHISSTRKIHCQHICCFPYKNAHLVGTNISTSFKTEDGIK